MLTFFKDRITNTLFLIVPGLLFQNFKTSDSNTNKYYYHIFIYIGIVLTWTGLFSLETPNVRELLLENDIFHLVCIGAITRKYAELNRNSLPKNTYHFLTIVGFWLLFLAISFM